MADIKPGTWVDLVYKGGRYPRFFVGYDHRGNAVIEVKAGGFMTVKANRLKVRD